MTDPAIDAACIIAVVGLGLSRRLLVMLAARVSRKMVFRVHAHCKLLDLGLVHVGDVQEQVVGQGLFDYR